MSVAAAAIRMIRGYQKAKTKPKMSVKRSMRRSINRLSHTNWDWLDLWRLIFVVRNTESERKKEKDSFQAKATKKLGSINFPTLLVPAADKYSPSTLWFTVAITPTMKQSCKTFRSYLIWTLLCSCKYVNSNTKEALFLYSGNAPICSHSTETHKCSSGWTWKLASESSCYSFRHK